MVQREVHMLWRDWGKKIRRAAVGFQNTLMFRSHREATTVISAASIMEMGDYQGFSRKHLEKCCLVHAHIPFFMFYKPSASTLLVKYTSQRKRNVNNTGSRLLVLAVEGTTEKCRHGTEYQSTPYATGTIVAIIIIAIPALFS